MANSGIQKDENVSSLKIKNEAQLPIIDITKTNPAGKGKIGYDQTQNAIYYSNGVGWLAIDQGTGDLKADGSVPMTADFNLNTHKVIGVVTPTLGTDAANKYYVDSQNSGDLKSDGSVPMAADFNLNTHKVIGVVTPTLGTDAANKDYVDTSLSRETAQAYVGTDINNITTTSTIIFNIIDLDPGGIYNNSTGVFTIPATGTYAVNAALSGTVVTIPSAVTIELVVNSTIGYCISRTSISGAVVNDYDLVLYKELKLTAGDTVNFVIFLAGTATADILGVFGGVRQSWASVRRVV